MATAVSGSTKRAAPDQFGVAPKRETYWDPAAAGPLPKTTRERQEPRTSTYPFRIPR
jgi:hypothetical protein